MSSVLTAFVQGAGLLAGLYYIEKVSAEHRDELEAEAPDEEVLKIDEEKAGSSTSHSFAYSYPPDLKGGASLMYMVVTHALHTVRRW